MTGTDDRDYNFEKIEFTSVAYCEIVKREAEPFLNKEKELLDEDFKNLRTGSKKAFELYKKEYQKRTEISEKKEVLQYIKSLAKILIELNAIFIETKERIRHRKIEEKMKRIIDATKLFEDYFNTKKTSQTADKIQGKIEFITLNVPDAKIDRLTLYSFNKFFRPEGEVRIAIELEQARKSMLNRSKELRRKYGDVVKREIERLTNALKGTKNRAVVIEIQEQIKKFKEFLNLPDLEIKNSALEEISNRLRARTIIRADRLNKPPDNGIFRTVLNDCVIEGIWDGEILTVAQKEFSAAYLSTYALKVNLNNPEIQKQAKEWWEFSVKTMGESGARRYYEMVGYSLITKYPLPTEQCICILIGDPGSGKGTHLGALQEMMTFDNLELFAKAGPHKLADPREHFSTQKLQNKLALVEGDMKHRRIYDFSPVNDIFGGEPAEMEKKFKDPTVERPIFKAFWGSAPPLFRITQAGGAWRRMTFNVLNPPTTKDNSIKPRMISMLDGFFLNGLIGLSYFIKNNWKFTGEQSSEEIEELWSFHSDSIRVWAQQLTPEPSEIEKEVKGETIDGEKKIVIEKNVEARHVIDDLYEEYKAWCVKKEIEPEKPKRFSDWLNKHDFSTKDRPTIEEGKFKGSRKYVTYATFNDDEGQSENSEMNRTDDQLTWEAYFSKAPIKLDNVSDPRGQITHEREVKEDSNSNDENSYDHACSMPMTIGQKDEITQDTSISGSGNELPPCPIRFEKSPSQETEPNFPLSDPNQSYVIKKTILETAFRITDGKKGTWINPIDILKNILYSSNAVTLTISLEDLNERVLPVMAAEGLISMSNGKIALTGKKLEENEKIEYVLISALEDLPALAWKDRDYNVHQGDICHMPKEVVNTLMRQNRKIRIIEGNGQISDPAEVSVLKRGGQ